MSLLNIHNKSIFYDILFQIPIKRRLAIINGVKNYYKRLEYFPITIKLYEKLLNYLNNEIDYYCPKKNVHLIQYLIIHYMIWWMKYKQNFKKNLIILLN